jgi:hypothetical protein
MSKYCRIAFSVVCGALCVVCLVLWVRSHRWIDRIDGPLGQSYPGRTVAVVSTDGVLMVGVQPEQYNPYAAESHAFRFNRARFEPGARYQPDRGVVGFKVIRELNESGLQIPWWFLFGTTLIGGALPWITGRRQFSLRSLLIATTFVAVLLGVFVALLGR